MTSTVEPMDKSQENQLGDEKPMESKLSDKRREDNEAADGRPIPNDAAAETDETWETTRSKLPLRVEVEWLDFEHFKNRYTDDDGLAIIEVLCGDYQTPQEVAKEMARRNHGGQGTRVSTPKPKPRQPIHVDGESMWIQRVRIQSPQLVLLLSRLTGHCDKWATGHPRTFFQPFRAFHHYLPQLKECLRILQSRWASEDVNNGETIVGDLTSLNHVDFSQGKPEGPMAPDFAISGDCVDSVVTMDDVAELVDFIERHIEPLWRRAAGISHRRFRFHDLSMAFQPGDLLHVPPFVEPPGKPRSPSEGLILQEPPAPTTTADINQRTWRLYNVTEKPDSRHTTEPKRYLSLNVYYVDYDGKTYVPVRRTFDIWEYEGERDITTQPVYPLRFLEGAKKSQDAQTEQGRWFQKIIRDKHFLCDGWTLSRGPNRCGYSFEQSPALPTQHIDGHVIVDFLEGFESPELSRFGPPVWQRGLEGFTGVDWPDGVDALSIMHWKLSESSGQLELQGEIRERIQREELFGKHFTEVQVNARATLRADRIRQVITTVEDEELPLLPRRVVAYAFRQRRFVFLDISSLKSLTTSTSVLSDLKIDPSHKGMVTSLVQSHLDKQKTRKLHPGVNLGQDILRGKGSGLIILLHGVPGVGKTATAEAVAQANNKPLWVITCGDLGFTPKEVEESLSGIFRLAQLWDCVLLLDEADIVLSRRELSDLKRNALVSVFLRVLEYYSGILFLTTNRVGTLDEAFKSRIHISLYYPPLNKRQTIAIFNVNIRKLQDIVDKKHAMETDRTGGEGDKTDNVKFHIDSAEILKWADWHFEHNRRNPEQRWNGRQIRNAFQVAYSLALFGDHDGENKSGQDVTETVTMGNQLDWRQFDAVAKAMERFEGYLYHAIGGTSGDQARKEHIRDDDYDDRATQREMYEYYHPQSSRWRPSNSSQASTGVLRNTAPPRNLSSVRHQYQPSILPRERPPTISGRYTQARTPNEFQPGASQRNQHEQQPPQVRRGGCGGIRSASRTPEPSNPRDWDRGRADNGGYEDQGHFGDEGRPEYEPRNGDGEEGYYDEHDGGWR